MTRFCQTLHTRGDQQLLRRVQIGLRGQHRQIAVDAVLITQVRQIQPALFGKGIALERLNLLIVRAACRQSVRHFAEGRLDRLLVRCDLDVLLHRGEIEIGLVLAALEDRQA